ncbi:DUF2092 domain-containing protein [Cryobacterium sp. BB307]|uniref:LolA family protein n=1 Tax=Cryobacterium sp. BB307 TaxID=2716317 RepID=UPI00144572C9|nr:DUF2092 domain-containing protein [Cryobacterium sp. BB307]
MPFPVGVAFTRVFNEESTVVWQQSRWLPAIVAPAVVAAGVLGVSAASSVDLPGKTPEQVLALVAGHTVDAFSGTLEQHSELGLPELPDVGTPTGDDVAAALDLLAGSHTVRVYVDGPSKARVQVMERFDERDLVRNGADAWLYDSSTQTATHFAVPDAASGHSDMDPQHMGMTPEDLAARFLDTADPSTEVTLGDTTSVAGRAAYQLELDPRTEATLVDMVTIAVDGETGLPLAVTVFAVGQAAPAASVAFTDITLETPPAERFEFTPPPGTTVTEHAKKAEGDKRADSGEEPTTLGRGWETVVVLPAGSAPVDALQSPQLQQLSTTVPGGRLISTALVSVLVTDDGSVLMGAVPPETLLSLASGQ